MPGISSKSITIPTSPGVTFNLPATLKSSGAGYFIVQAPLFHRFGDCRIQLRIYVTYTYTPDFVVAAQIMYCQAVRKMLLYSRL
jgi:hypothetical protein